MAADDEDDDDEEGERNAWFLRIEAATLRAIDNLRLLHQEADLLVGNPPHPPAQQWWHVAALRRAAETRALPRMFFASPVAQS